MRNISRSEPHVLQHKTSPIHRPIPSFATNCQKIPSGFLSACRYHVRRGCLTRLPNTRLGRLARCANFEDAREFCDIPYDNSPKEYFFDRNGDNFSSILGKTHITTIRKTKADNLVIQKALGLVF